MAKENARYRFSATIYKVGINPCVDVPVVVTDQLKKVKGYIKVRGQINGFDFKKSLVPVKDAPYRLFVDLKMLEGGGKEVGKVARFVIWEDKHIVKKDYPVPPMLVKTLKPKKLARLRSSHLPGKKIF